MTPKQKRVYEVIENYIKEKGYSPSVRDIGKELNLNVSTVHGYLLRLREKEYIEFEDGICRSIRINKKLEF